MCFYTLETLAKFVMPSIIELNPTEIVIAKPAAGEVICNFFKTFVIFNLLNNLWVYISNIFHDFFIYYGFCSLYLLSSPYLLCMKSFNTDEKKRIPKQSHKHITQYSQFCKSLLRLLLLLLPHSPSISTRSRKNEEIFDLSLKSASSVMDLCRRKKSWCSFVRVHQEMLLTWSSLHYTL